MGEAQRLSAQPFDQTQDDCLGLGAIPQGLLGRVTGQDLFIQAEAQEVSGLDG